MSTIRSLIVKVGADLTGFKTGMNTASTGVTKFSKTVANSQNTMSGFSMSAKSLFTGLSVAAVVAGLTRFTKSSTELASNLTEVQNVVDVTFSQSAEKINQFAQSAGKNFGLSELSAKKYTGTMGAMLKSSGLSGDALVEMSTRIAGLTGDFASFYNLKSDEAFEKIRSGISGETEPLKQLGINMSVANLKAFALSQGIKTSYESMDQASQTMLRYNYLMSVSGDAQNDFTRTSASYANQLRIADLNMQSFSATMGSGFMNIAYGAVRAFNDMSASLMGFATRFEIFTRIWFGDAKAVASGNNAATTSANNLTTAQSNLAKALKTSSSAARGGLLAFDKLNVLQDKASGADTASALADYYDQMAQSSQAVSQATAESTEGMGKFEEKVQAAYNWLFDLGGRIFTWWDTLKTRAIEKINQIKRNINESLTNIKTFIDGFKQAWTEFWSDPVGSIIKLKNKWDEFWSNSKAADEFKKNWDDRMDAILQGIVKLGNSLPDWWFKLTGTQRIVIPTYDYSTTNSSNAMQMRQYAVGTNYVPYTGPAVVHQGEQIVPASQNPFNGDSETNRLLRTLIAAVQSDRTTIVNVSDKQLVKQIAKPLLQEYGRLGLSMGG